jgi:hypothetical protein
LGRAVGAGNTAARGSQFGEEGFEAVRGGGTGGGEFLLQRVHRADQLLHFGHDPAWFAEGWE